MIRHDYECTKGHIFESTVDSTQLSKKIRCTFKGCRALSAIVYLSPRQRRQAQNFSPTLLFQHPLTGEVIVPGRNDKSHLPKKYLTKLAKDGFQEVNITSFREYETFRKEQGSKEKEKAQYYQHLEQQHYNEIAQQAIKDIKTGGNMLLPDKKGRLREVYIPPIDKMDHPQMRAIAEHAIRELQNHRVPLNHQESFIHSMEYDNQKYRDKDTDWKERH